ncbi:MAG: hypothetical protein AB7U59_01115 [Desulfovibrionaceae bacterium]
MSAAQVIKSMGAAIAFVDGKVKLSGLDRLPAKVAERVLAVARERREELRRELSGASAPAPGTGLEWVSCPPAFDAEKYGDLWAAFDLADVCKLYGVRVVRAGERILAVYPPALEPELIAYAGSLLVEAQPYLRQHMDKLPSLGAADAVTEIKRIMNAHKGLKFTKGDDGSRWPIYPRTWTAGQKATAQSLWFAVRTLVRTNFLAREWRPDGGCNLQTARARNRRGSRIFTSPKWKLDFTRARDLLCLTKYRQFLARSWTTACSPCAIIGLEVVGGQETEIILGATLGAIAQALVNFMV